MFIAALLVVSIESVCAVLVLLMNEGYTCINVIGNNQIVGTVRWQYVSFSEKSGAGGLRRDSSL